MQLFASKNCDSHDLLTAALVRSFDLKDLPKIAYTTEGKPYFPELPALHFSLSHSGPFVVCAMDNAPVGVDIELIIPRSDDLPAYALSNQEFSHFQRLGGDWPAFYSLWTKKEAYCKFTGTGLGKHFRETAPDAGLTYMSYSGEDWWATVCGTSTPPEEIIWLDFSDKV